mgnify:FL=1
MDPIISDLIEKYSIGKFMAQNLPAVYVKAIKFYYMNFETKYYNPNEFFVVLNVPVEVLEDCILQSAKVGKYSTFADYHEEYKSTHDLKDYEEILPIFLDPDFSCIIEDGWHRFHCYVNNGVRLIPCII